MEWQPIETAPKDGEFILVGGNRPWHGWEIAHVHWRQGNWWVAYGGGAILWVVTHWMPEPPAPEEE
jgi:hypothetical protein